MPEFDIVDLSGVTHTKDISDGYHTFGELYEWRHALFLLALKFSNNKQMAWWTENHHPDNEPMFEIEGSPAILVGLEFPDMSVQFHMPKRFLHVVRRYAHNEHHSPFYDGSNSPERALDYLKKFVGL